MRELDFINARFPALDAAIIAYVDMYAHDLPDQAVQAIKAATRFGNKKLSATMAPDAGVAEMEVPRTRSDRCREDAHLLKQCTPL
jgi:hypothetical protein